ncbi:MAG: hypothetical protein WC444_05920 [Candidatus Paceibacterota bacterium]
MAPKSREELNAYLKEWCRNNPERKKGYMVALSNRRRTALVNTYLDNFLPSKYSSYRSDLFNLLTSGECRSIKFSGGKNLLCGSLLYLLLLKNPKFPISSHSRSICNDFKFNGKRPLHSSILVLKKLQKAFNNTKATARLNRQQLDKIGLL